MTARPGLRLVEPGECPAPPRLSHWRFRVREAASWARWATMVAILGLVATSGMRRRAWLEGFAVALGDRPARSQLDHLDEWRQGNELAGELAYQANGRASLGPVRPFLIPEIRHALTDLGQPGPAWPPLVAPRPAVVATGEHAAPGPAARRPRSGRRATVPRHRRQPWPLRAARRIRDWIPLRDMLPGGQGRPGDLSAAA